MNRVCILKATKKILEMQSGGESADVNLMEARLNTLKQNAINIGYSEHDIEARWVTDAEYEAAKAEDPNEIARLAEITATEAIQLAKAQAFIDNLPSWTAVDTAINKIASLADAKEFIKKLARVVYWDIKGTED